MNQNKLKAAVKVYGAKLKEGVTGDDLKALIAEDTKAYTAEEVEEIFNVVNTPSANVSGPNDELDLSGFDYQNLKGKSFDDYLEVVASLKSYQDYDFEQYMASGDFKQEFDANLDKVFVLTGIIINQTKPVNTTRIPAHMAIAMNRQIFNRDNPPSNSRYFLLKKQA